LHSVQYWTTGKNQRYITKRIKLLDLPSDVRDSITRSKISSSGAEELVSVNRPIAYGYSMTIGPDGKPKVREFGNIRVPGIGGKGYAAGPQTMAEREQLADVMTSDKEVIVVIEMPGVTKENIKVKVRDISLEVTSSIIKIFWLVKANAI